MDNRLARARQAVPVPNWMVSMAENHLAEKTAFWSTIGVGLLGLAVRTGIEMSTLDSNIPILNKMAQATADNVLGLAQQLVPFAHTPELQIVEMLAGLTALAGITTGIGKFIDSRSNRKKINDLIEETRKTIIETGNITEILPISNHNIVVSPDGIPFMDMIAKIVDGSILITEAWNPYDPDHKVKGRADFPVVYKNQ